MSKYCFIQVKRNFSQQVGKSKFLNLKSYELVMVDTEKTVIPQENDNRIIYKRNGLKSSKPFEQESPLVICSTTGPAVPRWMAEIANIININKIYNMAEIKYVIKEYHPTVKLKI